MIVEKAKQMYFIQFYTLNEGMLKNAFAFTEKQARNIIDETFANWPKDNPALYATTKLKTYEK